MASPELKSDISIMNKQKVAIYIRSSTNHQDNSLSMQLADLREYSQKRDFVITKEYCDKGESGANSSRPQWRLLLKDAQKRAFDVVLTWRYDRFSRSVSDLSRCLQEFSALGIKFISHQEALDTSLPSGELIFHIFASIAQFERGLIRERIMAGLQNARRNGKRIGRPKINIDPKKVMDLREKGLTLRQISKKFKVSTAKIHFIVSQQNCVISN